MVEEVIFKDAFGSFVIGVTLGATDNVSGDYPEVPDIEIEEGERSSLTCSYGRFDKLDLEDAEG